MRTRDAGLFLLRAAVGGTLAAHGAQKLFGWFGGYGLEGTGAGFEMMGFRPGRPHAAAAGLGEALGGSMLVLGLATPAAGCAAAATMAVASSTHAPKGFFAAKGGMELSAVIGAGGMAAALAGPGSWSVDRLLGYRLARPWVLAAAVCATAPAAAAIIARRHRAMSPQSEIDLRTGSAEQPTSAGADTREQPVQA